ncbi:MAG: NUDIX hydrolase [Candidatus Portnoybacteria bacterium]|nr:NUDIX hydrolase [Candidatus Portnoybacteria bacterium]
MTKKSEKIDVVNKKDIVIGETNAHEANAKSLLHRVVGVLLFTPEGRMIVQTGNKFNKYDIAVGGHVGVGENPDEAATRELKEELNMITPLKKISAFLPQEARHSHFWHIYEGQVPKDWVFNPTQEVSSLTTMEIKEIVDGMRNNANDWTFGFQNVMRDYLKVKNIEPTS